MRRAVAGALALVATALLVRPGPLALFGTDAACYARIAAELAARPVSTWLDVRWGGEPFFEHPPLGLWLEAAWFAMTASTASAAVWYARLCWLGTALVAWRVARRDDGELDGAPVLVALVTLPAFVYETQNPMLEAPLTLACALGLWATVRLATSRWAPAGFALAFAAAFFVKGVMALALLPMLGWAVLVDGATPRRAALAGGLALGLLALLLAGLEAARAAAELTPLLPAYLERRVVKLSVEGGPNTQPSPFFYLRTLAAWHGPALGAFALLPLAWRWMTAPWRRLALLGAAWTGVVLVALSAAAQKNDWYIVPIVPGAALAIAAVLSVPFGLRPRWVAPACLVGALALGIVQLRHHDTPREQAIRAVATLAAPPPGSRVQNCGPTGTWVTEHLFAFHWGAVAVPCGEDAPLRFDGTSLRGAE